MTYATWGWGNGGWEGHKPDSMTIAYLKRQARTMRIQSWRALPTLSRQLIALADQYDLRVDELLRVGEIFRRADNQGA